MFEEKTEGQCDYSTGSEGKPSRKQVSTGRVRLVRKLPAGQTGEPALHCILCVSGSHWKLFSRGVTKSHLNLEKIRQAAALRVD